MEPLKEMFNAAYFKLLASKLKEVSPGFNDKGFFKAVLEGLDPLSLNERMRHATVILRRFLSGDYIQDLDILMKVAHKMPVGYTSLLFPDYVCQYGMEKFDESLTALKYFTVFGSSEFAIRYFLRQDFERTIKVMQSWTRDKNEHVRRLASEGSRPRLPWSFKLDAVIADPSLTVPILEALKEDESLYVRKSVANHLNDFSKDHPEYLISILRNWDQVHAGSAWIIKHASRSLIKKGNKDSLSIFNYEKAPKLSLRNFKVLTPKVKLGERLNFEFELISQKKKEQKLVVDYLLHYQRPQGKKSVKVFKLKDLVLKPGRTEQLKSSQLIKDFTTRKHYAGKHLLQIQVNGQIIDERSFHLFT
jgi:3-methyladenine DNA glycosylase AlkC